MKSSNRCVIDDSRCFNGSSDVMIFDLNDATGALVDGRTLEADAKSGIASLISEAIL